MERLFNHFGIKSDTQSKLDSDDERRKQKEAMYNMYNPTTNNRPVTGSSAKQAGAEAEEVRGLRQPPKDPPGDAWSKTGVSSRCSSQNKKSVPVKIKLASDVTKGNIEFSHIPKTTSTRNTNSGSSCKEVPNKRSRNAGIPNCPVDTAASDLVPPDFPKPPVMPAPLTHQQRLQQMYENSPYASKHGSGTRPNPTNKKKRASSYSSGTATTAGVPNSVSSTDDVTSSKCHNHPVISKFQS